MATTTTNYGLTKPATSDKYDVTIFNANADKIDTQMKANADAVATKQATITGAATTITDSNLTASRVVVSDASGKVTASDITATELGYLDNATGNIQTQLDGKLASTGTAVKATADASGNTITSTYATKTELSSKVTDLEAKIADAGVKITGGATTIVSDNLTASRALVSDASGKVAVSVVTSTELGYLDGVTSAIQTQLNGKLSTTGTAAKATADASGNDIESTYAKKTDIPSMITVDSALSSTSTNPVQNKVINSALADKLSTTGTAVKATADANGNNIASTYATKTENATKLPLSGGTMTGQLIAQGNTAYSTGQVRNIYLSTEEPTDDVGNNGDIWFIYSA